MPPRIYLSGLTRLEDARFASAMGADYLAFDQNETSPRYAAPEQVRAIMAWVTGPEPVGVFEDAAPEDVNWACAEAGFRLARLDGHEPPEACAAVAVPVIKTVRLRHDASFEQFHALLAPYRGAAAAVRLDVTGTSLFGDGAESASWRLIRDLARSFDLVLAGALTPSNVAEALALIRPSAIDVGPTVEEAPGVMDFDRLGAFFDAVRAAT